jgi:mRNA interferase MazF
MVATIKTSIALPKALCDQAELLAHSLKISRNHLFGIAIENFIRNYPSQSVLDEMNETDPDQPDPNEPSRSSYQDAQPVGQIDEGQAEINQGDIYWVKVDDLSGSEPGIRHPYVVLQANVFNHSRVPTVVACALTSNIKRANSPGNVLLEVGEANLPKQSVVEVSKVSTVDKTQVGEYIGSLPEERINQILAGMRFVQLSFFARSRGARLRSRL